jgi:PAS domain S-box-containing protein
MPYELTPLLIPFALTVGCLLAPWYFAGEFSDERFHTALVLWTTPIVIWSVAVLLRTSATTMTVERLWHNVRFVGPAFGAVGYFLFTAVYTNHDTWFRRRRLWALFAVPVLTLILVWTNPRHMLVRASVESASAGPFVMAYTPGPWFVVHALYSYTLVLVGTVWLVRRLWEYRGHIFFRRQIVSVLLGVLIVMTASLSFNVGITTVDWTPVAGALSAIIFAVAATEYRFLDLSPLARETVVENMESGMVVTNVDGQIIDANSAAATILGTDTDELIGDRLDAVFVTSTETIEEVMATAAKRKTVQVRTNGVEYYELAVSPVSVPSGKRAGKVITFSDVTTRVERQQRLQEQKRSLERQNERLEKFTGVVSHDLRNPLNVANARLGLARNECDSEHLDDVTNALDRMETLIDDLLTLTREGERVDETDAVDLADTVDRCWRTVETADATLVVETDRTIGADRSRVQQLLENLFRNAVEHGGETVRITVGDLDTGFYVTDDGPGIPGDEREQVFDAGYSNEDDGTGLGLNIVQEIAEAHGWDVTVTGSAGGGARFEISGVERAATEPSADG